MKSCPDSSCTASKEFEGIFEWMIGPIIISNMRNFQFELCIKQCIICHITGEIDNICSWKLINKAFNLMNMGEGIWFFVEIDEDSLLWMCLRMNGFKNRMTKIIVGDGMICPLLSDSKWGFFSGHYCFCSWQKITVEEFCCRFLRISNSSEKHKMFTNNCRSKQKKQIPSIMRKIPFFTQDFSTSEEFKNIFIWSKSQHILEVVNSFSAPVFDKTYFGYLIFGE